MSNSGKFRMNEGDWVCCDPQCANVNFARRSTCNRCGKGMDTNEENSKAVKLEKSSLPQRMKLGHEIGKAAAEKSRGLFSADDWQCGRCGNVNWARRQQCNMCNAPKYGEVEERTGLGGGYNERENIEYIEREESDGEYDDFGRKKKKFRGNPTSSADPVKTAIPEKPKEKIEEEEAGDISKYKLDDDDEDEEDDDADLSKYDLSGWGDEDEEEKKANKHSLKSNHKSDSYSKSRSSSSSSASSRSRSPSHASRSSRSSRSRSSSSSHSSSSSKQQNKGQTAHSRSRAHSQKNYSGSGKSSSAWRSRSRERERPVSKSPVYRKR